MDQEDRRSMCSVQPKERAVDSEYKKLGKHDGIHEEMREESSSHDSKSSTVATKCYQEYFHRPIQFKVKRV